MSSLLSWNSRWSTPTHVTCTYASTRLTFCRIQSPPTHRASRDKSHARLSVHVFHTTLLLSLAYILRVDPSLQSFTADLCPCLFHAIPHHIPRCFPSLLSLNIIPRCCPSSLSLKYRSRLWLTMAHATILPSSPSPLSFASILRRNPYFSTPAM